MNALFALIQMFAHNVTGRRVRRPRRPSRRTQLLAMLRRLAYGGQP